MITNSLIFLDDILSDFLTYQTISDYITASVVAKKGLFVARFSSDFKLFNLVKQWGKEKCTYSSLIDNFKIRMFDLNPKFGDISLAYKVL